jgi:hypothetical protein
MPASQLQDSIIQAQASRLRKRHTLFGWNYQAKDRLAPSIPFKLVAYGAVTESVVRSRRRYHVQKTARNALPTALERPAATTVAAVVAAHVRTITSATERPPARTVSAFRGHLSSATTKNPAPMISVIWTRVAATAMSTMACHV